MAYRVRIADVAQVAEANKPHQEKTVATVKTIEGRDTIRITELLDCIWNLDGIWLEARNRSDGSRAHGNITVKPYTYRRAAKDNWTAARYIASRLSCLYPDFFFRVKWPDGATCNKNAKLSTLRAAYREADMYA